MDSSVFCSFDVSRSDALWLEIEQFWELPIIMTTNWLNVLTDAMWPRREGVSIRVDDHEQLVVPEALESNGESGLFA